MLYACKISGWITEQNLETKTNVFCTFYFRFERFYAVFFTSSTLQARLLLEISIHTADACILAMSCVGYARARLKNPFESP